jgi:hypothetical protein
VKSADNPQPSQVRKEGIPRILFRHQKIEEMRRILPVLWELHDRSAFALSPLTEFDRIALPHCVPKGLNLFELAQLGVEDCRTQLTHEVAGTDVDPGIFIDLSAEESGSIRAFLPDNLGSF